ncbi:MAG: hypothetical protein N2V78_06345 [Methanophagales archaeon]|nr:hypothetical protein [Methanophagales archaeon]
MLWGELKQTLDIVNITGLNKDYTILLEGVVNRLRAVGIKIGTMFLDREFFNLPSILTLSSLGVDFIMAARINKRIKRMLEEHKRKNGVTSAIFKYRFVDKRSPEFYLVAIPNPDYDPKDDKKKAEFLLFSTSINFGSAEEFVKRVPEEYRRRYGKLQ